MRQFGLCKNVTPPHLKKNQYYPSRISLKCPNQTQFYFCNLFQENNSNHIKCFIHESVQNVIRGKNRYNLSTQAPGLNYCPAFGEIQCGD